MEEINQSIGEVNYGHNNADWRSLRPSKQISTYLGEVPRPTEPLGPRLDMVQAEQCGSRPYRPTVPYGIGIAASSTFTPWDRIRDQTSRDTRKRRNLTSGRDLEGDLAFRHHPRCYEDHWRLHHHLHRLHHHLHPICVHLVVFPKPSCGFAQVLVHPFVFHSYYHDDVDCLYVWVVPFVLGEHGEALALFLNEIKMSWLQFMYMY